MARKDRKDRAENPAKYQQDQELIRWAYQDTWRNREPDVYASSRADMDDNLCGKWPILRDLLASWKKNGDKVLLFSRSTRLLNALEYWIERGKPTVVDENDKTETCNAFPVNYNYTRLDGSVPAEQRKLSRTLLMLGTDD